VSSDTEIASVGDSREGPRNDGMGVVARRLLREDNKKKPRNDGMGVVALRLLREDNKKKPRNDGEGSAEQGKDYESI